MDTPEHPVNNGGRPNGQANPPAPSRSPLANLLGTILENRNLWRSVLGEAGPSFDSNPDR